MVPIHPQPTPGRPDQLRWVIPAGVLACTGRLAAVPEPLAALLSDGTLAEITVEPGGVLTRLGEGRCWSGDGPRVRTALHAALEDPGGWRPAAGSAEPGGRDAVLEAEVRRLLAGPVGAFARSHGGTIDLVVVCDGVVTVRLGGACRACPAAWVTLRYRLESEVRRRCPWIRKVVQATSGRDRNPTVRAGAGRHDRPAEGE